MIKIAGIVMSVVIGMGAATATFADLGDVTTTIDAGVTSTFVETQEWVPNTYTAADGTTSYTQVSEGSDSYSNGSGGFSLKTDLDALTGLTFNAGSDSVQTQITGDVTLSGTVITFANGATLDLASINTDTFASISGTVITFANGSTFDVASVDTNTFVTFGNTGQVFSADGTAGINLATDAELAAAILAAVGLASTGSDAATGLNLAVETNTSSIDTLNGTGAGSVAKAQADAQAYADTNDTSVSSVSVSATGIMTFVMANGTNFTADVSSLLDNSDTQLTEAQVDAFVANNSFASTTNVADALAAAKTYADANDSDTQLNEAAVDAFVADNGFAQASDVTANTADIDANTAAIGSVATLGVFTSSSNVVYTQDATDGKFYTPGNSFGYSQSVIQSWINGGDGSWTVEASVGLGLIQDVADNASLISANAADISTNAGNISANAADISTNAGNISTNATNIANLDSSKQDVLTAAQLASFTAQTTDTNTFASISGTVVTFANGNTFDIASVDTDTNTFASISGTVVTFADGSTFDIATVDTNTFASISGSVITFVGGSTFDIASVDTNTQLSNAQVRALISVAAGGSLSYDSDTGVLSFTERSDSTVQTLARTALSVTGDLSYNSTTGVIGFTQRTDSAVTVLADASATSKITAALLSGGNIEQAIGASLDLAIGSVGTVLDGVRSGQSGYLGAAADLQDQIDTLSSTASGSSSTNATAITALESNLGVASNGTDAATGLNLDVETNTAAIATEVADRIAAITKEVSDRNAAILVETNARIAADNAAAAFDLAARNAIQSDVNQNEANSDAADAALSGRSDALEGAVFTASERVFGVAVLWGVSTYTESDDGFWYNAGGGKIANATMYDYYLANGDAVFTTTPVAIDPTAIDNVAANADAISALSSSSTAALSVAISTEVADRNAAILVETNARIAADDLLQDGIDANTASIGSVGSAAVLGVFTSSANAVYTQDATDGRFYTPGNNYGYSLNTIQSWINGGDGSWTVESVAAVDATGLRGDIADNAADIAALDSRITSELETVALDLAEAKSNLQDSINALANGAVADNAADIVTNAGIVSQLEADLKLLITANADAIVVERLAREAADTALTLALDNEADVREQADAVHTADIAANVVDIAKNAADLVTEAAVRAAADSQIAADLVAEAVTRANADLAHDMKLAAHEGRLNDIDVILADHESRISALEALHVVDKSFSKVIDGPNGTKIVMHFDADGTLRGKARTLTFLENPVIHGEMDILWNDQGKAVNAITGKLVDANTGLPMADKVEAEVKLEAAYVAAELQSDTRFGTSIEADVVVEAKVAAPVITQSEMNAEIAKFQSMFNMPIVESVAVEMPVAKAAVVEMASEEVVVIDEAKSLAASVADLFSGMFSSKTEVKAEVKVTEKSPMNVGNPFGK